MSRLGDKLKRLRSVMLTRPKPIPKPQRKPRKPAQTVRHAAGPCFFCPICGEAVTVDPQSHTEHVHQDGATTTVQLAGTCRAIACKQVSVWDIEYGPLKDTEPTNATLDTDTKADPGGDAAEASPSLDG